LIDIAATDEMTLNASTNGNQQEGHLSGSHRPVVAVAQVTDSPAPSATKEHLLLGFAATA
jgi:hypothetical protein